MPRPIQSKPQEKLWSASGIALSITALGGLIGTLIFGQPNLSADTEPGVTAPSGISLQTPIFGTTPAQSEEAVDSFELFEATEVIPQSAAPVPNQTDNPRLPLVRDRHRHQYEAGDQRLQLVYKSLAPKVPEHKIIIAPRGAGTGTHQNVTQLESYRSVSQSHTVDENGADEQTLTLPAFSLPQVPMDDTGDSEPIAAEVESEFLTFPLAPPMDRSPSTLESPLGVLGTMPRVVVQDSGLQTPGPPMSTDVLPPMPGEERREVTPAPATELMPSTTDQHRSLIQTAPQRGGYEPPAPDARPTQPVPDLPFGPPLAVGGVENPEPVRDPISLPVSPGHSGSGSPALPENFGPTVTPEVLLPDPGHSHIPLSPSIDPPAAVYDAPIFGHSFLQQLPGTSGFRATVESDAAPWMEPYKSRVMATPEPEKLPVIPAIPDIPADFEPWWNNAVRGSIGVYSESHPVDVSGLLQDAMVYSPQVIAIKAEPEVQYRVVAQEAARFDWTGFLETTYDDLNDPVGSDLTTGNGEDRLLTRKVLGAGGFRRRTLQGGEFRFAQEIGHENQNSRFFVPNNQGTTRLELSYRQPLLDGAGQAYNESEIVLARIQANTSEDEVVSALQDHLTEVTEAYWTLYRARAEFFQRQKLLSSAEDVLKRLEGRSKVDTIPRQILRARAAVARARTRIQRTLARVKDAEAQLRLRVNSPYMLNGGQTELLPIEGPGFVTDTSDVQTILHTALANRPDISEAIRRMRAAGVRLGVSRNELLPRLDLLVETYVADLAGSSNVYQAFRGQLSDNRPGYTLGLEFEVPLGNRAAQAKFEQRQWELKRSINIFRATVEKSLTDVEIANREVQTAYSEIQSRYQSMMAADRESQYLLDRFEVLPSAEDSATLLLEDLLDSFERLADEEASFVQSEIDHAIALIKLRKEMGTLLRSRNSPPKLDGTQQAWVTERLQSNAAKQQVRPLDATQSNDDSSALRSVQSPVEVEARINDPAQGNIQIGYSVTHDRTRTAAKLPPRGVPIPLTPTTWRRPVPSGR